MEEFRDSIRIFGFVDDIFGGSHSYSDTKRISVIVKGHLIKGGFDANELKSFWEPRQADEHLGFIIDFNEGTLSVTPTRVQKFKTLLVSVLGVSNC